MNRGACMPDRPRKKTKFIKMVMIPPSSLRLRNESRKVLQAKGLRHGRQGRRHGKDPPLPPRSIADYCHIHPWIFCTL